MKNNRNKSMKPLSQPDTIGVPFGDLEGDDGALERFQDTKRKMYGIGVAIRKIAPIRRMSKSAFAKWKSGICYIGDDEPLRNHI